MKREFLQNLKIADQPLPKEIVDAIMEENGRDIEAAKKPFGDYDDLKARLEEANKTIEGFKGMDIDAIRKEADEYKARAERAEKDAAAKIADMEFNGLLTQAIAGAKGKNAKAITALLDLDALKASKNQEADITAALEALKGESGFLFDSDQTPPPYASGTGSAHLLGGITKEAFAKMGYRERLELKQNDPNTYDKMKE